MFSSSSSSSIQHIKRDTFYFHYTGFNRGGNNLVWAPGLYPTVCYMPRAGMSTKSWTVL